jgi:hypothetical protein
MSGEYRSRRDSIAARAALFSFLVELSSFGRRFPAASDQPGKPTVGRGRSPIAVAVLFAFDLLR